MVASGAGGCSTETNKIKQKVESISTLAVIKENAVQAECEKGCSTVKYGVETGSLTC